MMTRASAREKRLLLQHTLLFARFCPLPDLPVLKRSIASLTAIETDRSSKSEMIPTSPPAEDDIEDDCNGRHTSTPPPSKPSTPSSRQELGGLSPDVRRNYYPHEGPREEHWPVSIDDSPSSEGKQRDPNGVGLFNSANGGVAVAGNHLNVPGRVGGGSFSSGDGGNEGGRFQEVEASHSYSSGYGGGVRNGDVEAVNSGSDLAGFHTKQFTPPSLARGEESVDESDGLSMIDALDALLTAADSETHSDDESKRGRGWTGYGGGGGGGGWAQ